MNGLRVCYGEALDVDELPDELDDGGMGWRVLAVAADEVLPMKFLRRRDAEMAMRAIADLIDWTMDRESVASALEPLAKTIRRLMTESLQW